MSKQSSKEIAEALDEMENIECASYEQARFLSEQMAKIRELLASPELETALRTKGFCRCRGACCKPVAEAPNPPSAREWLNSDSGRGYLPPTDHDCHAGKYYEYYEESIAIAMDNYSETVAAPLRDEIERLKEVKK